MSGHAEVFQLVRTGDARALADALALGVDPDLRDGSGLTPLDVALRAEEMDCARVLLASGMQPAKSAVFILLE